MCACVLFYFCSVELRSFLTFFFPEELCLSENVLLCSPCFFFKSFYVYVFIDTTGNFLVLKFFFFTFAAFCRSCSCSSSLSAVDRSQLRRALYYAWRLHCMALPHYFFRNCIRNIIANKQKIQLIEK